MKVPYWGLLILCFNAAHANPFDTLGNTYVISEKDALVWLTERLNTLETSGALVKQQQKLRQQALNFIERPQKVRGLQKTTHPRTFEKDLTVTVPYDIKDHKGRVLYQAHTPINPLKLGVARKVLLFFDGDDNSQVLWALKEQSLRAGLAKLVLVNGPLAELSRRQKLKLYFDQGGRLIKQFGIKQVPALVEQQGDKLRVSEIKIE